ncbi:hypothetical protein ACVWZZ_003656 [Bradyrhizobium sp. LM6.10]
MKPERWGLSRYVAATVLRSPQNSLGLLLLGVLALVLAPMLAPIPSIGATGEPLLRLDQAEFIFSDSSEPPSDSAAWRRQILPDNWLVSRPGVWGYGWYRLHIVLPVEPDKLYAAYVPLLQTFGAFVRERRSRGPDGAL